MYYITTKKASGVISGVQTVENGPIQWSRELPSSCLLSQGIKKHLTPILAGLLEVNPQKMWTFEKFFNEVTNLLGKKKIYVYFMNRLSALRVYLDRWGEADEMKRNTDTEMKRKWNREIKEFKMIMFTIKLKTNISTTEEKVSMFGGRVT